NRTRRLRRAWVHLTPARYVVSDRPAAIETRVPDASTPRAGLEQVSGHDRRAYYLRLPRWSWIARRQPGHEAVMAIGGKIGRGMRAFPAARVSRHQIYRHAVGQHQPDPVPAGRLHWPQLHQVTVGQPDADLGHVGPDLAEQGRLEHREPGRIGLLG